MRDIECLQGSTNNATVKLAAAKLSLPCPHVVGQSRILMERTVPGVDVQRLVGAKAPIIFPARGCDIIKIVSGLHEGNV